MRVMPLYRIHRIKETPRENFRWAAHTGGEVVVKPKDYEGTRTVEGATPYAAWKRLLEEKEALVPGDLLEFLEENADSGAPNNLVRQPQLLITKYIGFEPARWFVPELRKVEARTEYSLSSENPGVVSTSSSR